MKLQELVQIRAGYPLRSSIEEDKSQSTYLVQVKHTSAEYGIHWDEAIRIQVHLKAVYLKDGDVLFVGKGAYNYAVEVKEEDIPNNCQALSATQFYVFSIQEKNKLLPGYLCWYLNQKLAQNYIDQHASGTAIRNIRKETLANLDIPIPPLQQQQAIIKLANAAKQERLLYQQLIANTQRMMDSVVQQISNGNENLQQK